MIDPGPGADMPAFRNSRPGGVIQRRGKRGKFFGDEMRYLFKYDFIRGVAGCLCAVWDFPAPTSARFLMPSWRTKSG